MAATNMPCGLVVLVAQRYCKPPTFSTGSDVIDSCWCNRLHSFSL